MRSCGVDTNKEPPTTPQMVAKPEVTDRSAGEREREACHALKKAIDEARHSGCSCGLCSWTVEERAAKVDAYGTAVVRATLERVRERITRIDKGNPAIEEALAVVDTLMREEQ